MVRTAPCTEGSTVQVQVSNGLRRAHRVLEQGGKNTILDP